jgi:hypothetical protein
VAAGEAAGTPWFAGCVAVAGCFAAQPASNAQSATETSEPRKALVTFVLKVGMFFVEFIERFSLTATARGLNLNLSTAPTLGLRVPCTVRDFAPREYTLSRGCLKYHFYNKRGSTRAAEKETEEVGASS